MKRLISTLAILLATVAGASEPEPKSSESFPGLEYISGTWRGGDGTTVIEEIWSTTAGGQMIGMFRMMNGSEARFYELMTIEPLDDGWVMYLRHFSPRLEAWEDKTGALVFDLVEIEGTRAVFDQRGADTNLIYDRVDDRMTVTLEKNVDGEWKRTPFEYRLE